MKPEFKNYDGFFAVNIAKSPFCMEIFFEFDKMEAFCKKILVRNFAENFAYSLASLIIWCVSPLSISEAKQIKGFPDAIKFLLDDDTYIGDYIFADLEFIDTRIEEIVEKIKKMATSEQNIKQLTDNISKHFANHFVFVNSNQLTVGPPTNLSFVWTSAKADIKYDKVSHPLERLALFLFCFCTLLLIILLCLTRKKHSSRQSQFIENSV